MRHLLFFACLLPLCSGAAYAQSACPTVADLPGGIVVVDDQDATETFYPLTPGVIRSDYLDTDGTGSRTLLGQGVYLLQYLYLEGGAPQVNTRATTSYPMTPVDMPVPTPGGAWNTAFASVSETGRVSGEVLAAVFGDLSELTIGACSYDMIPVTIDYQSDGYQELIYFLPQLGFGLFVGTRNVGEDFDLTTFLSIKAANEE